MRALSLGLIFAAGAIVADGCVIELDRQLACGDGHVDELAGEQCDPEVPSSYEGACPLIYPMGEGACDPDTCEIIATPQQCAFCGDGTIHAAAGEECDGSNIGATCKAGGQPSCTIDCKVDFSNCEKCGNGVLDEGEECDPMDIDHLATGRPCAGNDTLTALVAPYGTLPYTSGVAVACLDDCRFDRSGCGYCGNLQQDPATQVTLPPHFAESLAEVCDGDDFDREALESEYPGACENPAQPNVACNTTCTGFVPRAVDQPCCLAKGAPCPEDGAAVRCCYEYAHPEVEDACTQTIVGGDGGGANEQGMPIACR